MESQYYNKTNILDDIGNSVNEEVVSKKEAYEYMRGVNNQCKLQPAKMLTRQKEINQLLLSFRTWQGLTTGYQ